MNRNVIFQTLTANFWLFTLPLTGAILTISCKKPNYCTCSEDFCLKLCPPKPTPPGTHLSKPCASAGEEQIVFLPDDSAQLDGSNSVDLGGSALYLWRQISGPSQTSISNSSKAIAGVHNLSTGTYQFELKVSDSSSGLYSIDTTTVLVTVTPTVDCSANRSMIPVHLMPFNNLSQNKEYVSSALVGCPCRIVFAGGFADNSINSGVDMFELTNNSYTSAMLSQARQGMAVATVDNKVLFAGGGDHDIGWVTTRVDIYDAVTGQWARSELGEARSYLAAATIGHKVFFAGGGNWGLNNNQYYTGSARVDIYDDSTRTWAMASLSEGRYDLTATTCGHKIYFAGGRTAADTANGHVSRTIDIYDADNNSWTVSQLNEPKAEMASIAVGNKIFWAGGYSGADSGKASNNVEIRDVTSGTSVFSCLHVGKFRLQAALKGNTIVFFNGYTRETYTADDLNQIDLLDLTTGKWSVGILDRPLTSAGIISAKNKIYIAGGTFSGFPPFYNDVWTLDW